MLRGNKKGIALFIVLTLLLVVIVLASVVLNIMLIQFRLSHHQISRIQAYYASQAGIVYTLERLRAGDTNWVPSPDTSPNTRTRTLCRSGCDVNDPNLPDSIQQVNIVIEAAGTGISGSRRLNATATYTYTP